MPSPIAGWLGGRAFRQGSAVQAGPHPAAGFHRCAGGGRPGRDARRPHPPGRQPAEGEPAGAGRPGDRPLGPGRRVRARRRADQERRHRVRAQRRALPLPALGPGRVRQFPRRAARHRHLPPGEPGVSRPDRLDLAQRPRHVRLPRHALRHRQPHHDGERPRHPGLGRRRHRGGGGDARPADRHADPRRDRLPPDRQAARGRDRHRPRADRHADAPHARAWSANSWNSSAPAWTTWRCRTAPPSATWPPNTAPPAASSRSTRSRWTICA